MTSKRKMIETAWNGYRKMCVPADASAIQVAETRQAFFGGASVIFTSILNSLTSGEEPKQEDLYLLSDVQEEINEFGQSLDHRYRLGS